MEPALLGRRFGLSTVVVVISVLLWGFIWGPVGMLLAVPLTMMVKVGLDNSAGTNDKVGPENKVGSRNKVGPPVNICVYILRTAYCLFSVLRTECGLAPGREEQAALACAPAEHRPVAGSHGHVCEAARSPHLLTQESLFPMERMRWL